MHGSRSRWKALLATGVLTLAFAGMASVAQAAPAAAQHVGNVGNIGHGGRGGHGGHGGTTSSKSGPVSVAYVEVNNNSMLNVGKYTLANGGGNVFDIAVIFAANIDYDGSNAYLSFNPQVQSVLDNVATQVRPLQAQGIKVELSILGNHQGAGFANFPSQAAAAAFAQQLSDAVTRYGLDGIDFDDEYADYGTNNTGQPNASSFVYLVQALRNDMPDKLITMYDIGPAASSLTYDGTDVGPLFDYAWNPYYDSWNVPSINLPNSRLSPAAIDVTSTPSSDAASLAQQTVDGGYGVFMTYNLGASDIHDYISSFTNVLYGSDAVNNG